MYVCIYVCMYVCMCVCVCMLQNNAARVDSVSKMYDQITPFLKDLLWLPIRIRIELKILLLSFKCMQGCFSIHLKE